MIKTHEPNPNGSGGEVEAPIVLIEKIETELDKLMSSNSHKNIALNLHPFIAAYITKGLPSIQVKWFFKYKKWIKILSRDAYPYLKFEFTKNNGKVIK